MMLRFDGGKIGRLESKFTIGSAEEGSDSFQRTTPHKTLEASTNGLLITDFRNNYIILGWVTPPGSGSSQDIEVDL